MVGWGRLKYPSCARARSEDVCAVWTNDSFILGSAVPGEASETMVELCLWAIYRTSTKLAIYCDYLWYILHATKFYVPRLRYPCFGWTPLYFLPLHFCPSSVCFVLAIYRQIAKFSSFPRPVSLCVCLFFEKVYFYSNLFQILSSLNWWVAGGFCCALCSSLLHRPTGCAVPHNFHPSWHCLLLEGAVRPNPVWLLHRVLVLLASLP